MDKTALIFILAPLLLAVLIISVLLILQRRQQQKNIILLSQLDNKAIIDAQHKNKKVDNDFNLKLIQAGITQKEYMEAKLLFSLIGIIILGVLPFFLPLMYGIISVVVGVLAIVFGGKIYINIAKAERVEKIDRDLGVFLDLVNVILEAGGSLKNAFFEVSRRAQGIIDNELLKEISILEYEMTNYSTKVAYENLKNRVDSKELAKIIDFLILSEETGIGVKNIFAMQSDEMRQEKFYKIKGKVNTLNMYLMLIIFLFVLPAFGAFIVFPIMGGTLTIGI
ncbi:type II secretion system F family protein [Halarcobacter bivalviorum]|uniref:type II secretion system F family protein n=1 Tax=Halarcobacter bivalviorum TaxID=663364 RepID=UPI0013E8F98E|nr:type II secretion system F family protein [Halarcobacter bivalviorum]